MSRTILCCIAVSSLIISGVFIAPFANAMQGSPQDRAFRAWDKNRDGILERAEVPTGPRQMFDRVDRNQDGKITLSEHIAAFTNKPTGPTAGATSGFKRHTVRQKWKQEQTGFDREFFVHAPATLTAERSTKRTNNKCPVTFVFHGNGGTAHATMGRWPQLLEGHLIVAPQGYERSWNISNEKSKAPDVVFFNLILNHIEDKYPNADLSKISLIGFSNGAGFIFRLLIELDGTTKVTNAVPLVSSMVEEQYHDQAFWKRSDDSNANYDLRTTPMGKCNLLTIHGTADRVVPYAGGMRGPHAKHLSAQLTAYAWAKQQGYRGSQIADNAGKLLENNIIRYNYEGANVTHLKVLNGGHGFGPAGRQVNELVRDFVQRNLR
jgi:poly(3-hydroxybutyrate) depolymerase